MSTPFTENNRFDYSTLTPKSWVLMLGGYCGKDANILAEKYGCAVVCYEPIKSFCDALAARFTGTPLSSLIYAVNKGVAADTRREMFGVQGERSGIACAGNHSESVDLVSIASVLNEWSDKFGCGPELVVCNIEGMEYPVLEAMLDDGLEVRCAHLQIQPHSVIPRAAERWAAIRNRLLMNFRITSEDPQMDIGWLLLARK